MLKDPLLNWPDGPFPYDALREVGVTPDMDMRGVGDALYGLIGRGLLTPERRSAWNELMAVESRLWVDLFLYPVAFERVLEVLCMLAGSEGGGASASGEGDSETTLLLALIAEELRRETRERQSGGRAISSA